MTPRAPLEKIVLRGNALQRGRAHGEQLRHRVREHLHRWEEALVADLGVDPEAYVQRFFAETDFLPAIRRWTPDLLDEVRGIAEGAGTDFQRTLIRQLSDEEPWFRREIKLQSMCSGGCSSVGVAARGGHPALVAQNMDVAPWWDGHQVLLHIIDPDSPVETLVFTVAGKISLAGLSSTGLAMCCNALPQLDYCRDGLPEDFVVRGFLAQPDFERGLEFLSSIRHASGQNYAIGAPGGRPWNVECSANRVSATTATGDLDRIVHTNHPLANHERAIFERMSAGLSAADLRRLYHGTSYQRLGVLESQFAALARRPRIGDIKNALSSHDGAVCRHGELDGRADNFTLGCLIMELDRPPRLHVAPGPPCCTPFQTFSFGAEIDG